MVEINEGMSGIKQTHKMKCENKTPGAHACPPKVCNEIRKFELEEKRFKLGVHAWFLKTTFVRMYVCLCVGACVRP